MRRVHFVFAAFCMLAALPAALAGGSGSGGFSDACGYEQYGQKGCRYMPGLPTYCCKDSGGGGVCQQGWQPYYAGFNTLNVCDQPVVGNPNHCDPDPYDPLDNGELCEPVYPCCDTGNDCFVGQTCQYDAGQLGTCFDGMVCNGPAVNTCGNGKCDGDETSLSCFDDCCGELGEYNDIGFCCAGLVSNPPGGGWCEVDCAADVAHWDASNSCMLAGGASACGCCGGLPSSNGVCGLPLCGTAGTEGLQCQTQTDPPPGGSGYYCSDGLIDANDGDDVGRCCPANTYWDSGFLICRPTNECTVTSPVFCGPKAASFGVGNYLTFMQDAICVGITAVGNKPAGLNACTPVSGGKNGMLSYFDWLDKFGNNQGASVYP